MNRTFENAAEPARRRAAGYVFAHSVWDAALVGISLVEAALLAGCTLAFPLVGRVAGTPTAVAVYAALGVFLVFVNCTNYQCVAHNFIHNPFFRSKRLNDAFALINSVGLGGPQTLYRVHHLNHHKYGNDARDPVTGTTRDRSSTYLHSKIPGREEPLWRYALLGPLRLDIGGLLEDARRRGLAGRIALETAVWLLFVAFLTFESYRGALFFYLPVWYFGQVAAYAENYLEHHGAVPGDRETDSVSSYGAFYNFIWFNNGYHQEHHFRPQVHWRDVKALRSCMRPESERRVVPFAHWFNL